MSAVLMHFMINFVGELLGLTVRAELCYVLLWAIAALGVILIWEPKTLTVGRPWSRFRGI